MSSQCKYQNGFGYRWLEKSLSSHIGVKNQQINTQAKSFIFRCIEKVVKSDFVRTYDHSCADKFLQHDVRANLKMKNSN